MKTIKSLLLVGVMFITFACENDDQEEPATLEGNYTGVFERDGNAGNLELNLVGGTYNGESVFETFPAICNGTYVADEDSIDFTNACVWTADFDWSLILNGKWAYELDGNNLTMVHANGDRYTLRK